MPKKPIIDQHPKKKEIINAIVAGKMTQAAIAKKYGISLSAVNAYIKVRLVPEIAEKLERQAEKNKQEPGDLALARVERLITALEGLFDELRSKRDDFTTLVNTADGPVEVDAWQDRLRLAISASSEIRQASALLLKVYGRLVEKQAVTINLSQTNVWIAVRGAIMDATEGHPEIRAKIVRAIEAIE